MESRHTLCSLPTHGSPSHPVSGEVIGKDDAENASGTILLDVPALSPRASIVAPFTVTRIIKAIFYLDYYICQFVR